MNLSAIQLRIVAAVVRRPNQPWTTIEIGCGMQAKDARAVRDSLLVAGALVTTADRREDARGRLCPRTLYNVSPSVPQLPAIKAWIDSGQAYPLPMLALPKAKPIRPCPGVMADASERVLEAILRNPLAIWRNLRPTLGLTGKVADQTRDELWTADHIAFDVAEHLDARGGRRRHRVLIPCEASPLVKELRKRYGIPAPAGTPPWLPGEISRLLAPDATPANASRQAPVPPPGLRTPEPDAPRYNPFDAPPGPPRSFLEQIAEAQRARANLPPAPALASAPSWKEQAMREQDAADAEQARRERLDRDIAEARAELDKLAALDAMRQTPGEHKDPSHAWKDAEPDDEESLDDAEHPLDLTYPEDDATTA